MSYLPSLPENAVVLDVFAAFPETARHLMAYHQQLLRGPSPLSPAQRELIAAYVSGLNRCQYCHGVHAATAAALGVREDLLRQLAEDLDTAGVEPRLRPLLRYVRKLTVSRARISREDATAVFEAGWDERALHDAVSVCALFSFMTYIPHISEAIPPNLSLEF
ncbi:MAG: carboxymuconolactone decarboxylase family protein, partial [Acidobacteriota bacterium]